MTQKYRYYDVIEPLLDAKSLGIGSQLLCYLQILKDM